jgi:hypothetical protein
MVRTNSEAHHTDRLFSLSAGASSKTRNPFERWTSLSKSPSMAGGKMGFMIDCEQEKKPVSVVLVHLSNGFRVFDDAPALKVGDVVKTVSRIESITNSDRAGKWAS